MVRTCQPPFNCLVVCDVCAILDIAFPVKGKIDGKCCCLNEWEVQQPVETIGKQMS